MLCFPTRICVHRFSQLVKDWLPGGACAKGTEKGAVVKRVIDVLLREDHLFRHHAALTNGVPVFKVLRKEVALEKGHLVVVQFVQHVINIAQLNDVCVDINETLMLAQRKDKRSK